MTNSHGTYSSTSASSPSDGEPVSNANDKELQREVQRDTSTSDKSKLFAVLL